ncbi:hypothetical protein [Microbacterium sp. cx-55]|uniref:hypothetical protein n=1 Tax=Microbacterium sp. cx-55 TaxID=2875948 RepID=UPI001CC07390|nr:hypothetical protein [Microbacterium sp. cx-55]MBZ4486273.1 hypothetical protein [Microbacterium sp. cx-55]
MSDTQTALAGLEIESDSAPIQGGFGQGDTERETRAAIAEIEAERPLVGILRTVKQLAISLAKSIDRGNTKGRAVANEAAQLFAMMQQLSPAESSENADESHLTPEMRQILDALSAPAQFDTAPESDAAEL